MFLRRQEELTLLKQLYESEKFEFLVLYGRRRVGKTSLLQHFCKEHKAVFFSAQEKNDALNLEDFSKTIQMHFDGQAFGSFSDWQTALNYVTSRCGEERLVLIVDEFPFIAAENPSIKSIFQHTIDHAWKDKNIFLVLCGSSVSFMENEVMGYRSPLYGRATAQLELKPFDYYDSAAFFPNYSNIDKLLVYGILGGIPCYLQTFRNDRTIEENLAEQILHTGAFLKEEPQVLLKMELREPSVYNSIFEAIAGGASRMNDISTKIREESTKCAKYVSTLRSIKLLQKLTPCGEDETSKKTIYRIADQFYAFWYRFVFAERSYYELLGEEAAAKEIMMPETISDYMGTVFEQVCQQYMIRMAKSKRLPFVPYRIGRWWGNNPNTKKQDDVDILLLDKSGKSAVFCECKFKNELFDKKEFEGVMTSSEIFSRVDTKYYYLFSKSGFTDWVKKKAGENERIVLVTADELFEV